MSELSFCHRLTRLGLVYTAERGDGEAVLLLHGISSSADTFTGQIRELWRHNHLIAWDAPGYGRSFDPAFAPTMDDYADAAADILDGLGVDRAHVVGSSWGGVIATRVALRHPDRVRTLGLIASTPGRRKSREAWKSLEARCAMLRAGGVADYARERAPALISPASAPSHLAMVVSYVIRASVRLPGYEYAAASLIDTDHTDDLCEVKVPTAVVVGSDDGITGPKQSRQLAEGICSAEYEVIEQAGHLVHLECPTLVNTALARLWHRQRPGRD